MAANDEGWLLEPAPAAVPLTEPRNVRVRLETVARLLAEEAVPTSGPIRLLWRDTQGTVRSHPITNDLTIGRDARCALVLEEPHVSGWHCRLSLDERGQWLIEDLRSRNGTRVNGQPIARAALREGDVLEIGRVELVFVG